MGLLADKQRPNAVERNSDAVGVNARLSGNAGQAERQAVPLPDEDVARETDRIPDIRAGHPIEEIVRLTDDPVATHSVDRYRLHCRARTDDLPERVRIDGAPELRQERRCGRTCGEGQAGPGFFPFWLGVLVALCGAIILVREARAANGKAFFHDHTGLVSVVKVTATAAGMLVLTYLIGFTWSKAIDGGSAIRTNSGDTLRDGSQAMAKKVRDNPLGALLIAGGIGFALALLMSRPARRPPPRWRYYG